MNEPINKNLLRYVLVSVLFIFCNYSTDIVAKSKNCLKNPNFCVGQKNLPKCRGNDIRKMKNCSFVQKSEYGGNYILEIGDGDLKNGGTVSIYESLSDEQIKLIFGMGGVASGSLLKGNFSVNGLVSSNLQIPEGSVLTTFIGKFSFDTQGLNFKGMGFSLSELSYCPNFSASLGFNEVGKKHAYAWALRDYCNTQSIYGAYPKLRDRFNSLSLFQRKKIQEFLRERGLYNSSIDGEWGPRTLVGIFKFGILRIRSRDFNNNGNVEKLISVFSRDIDGFNESELREPEVNVARKKQRKSSDILKVASGTGFFISESGHLITNYHVVENCEPIKVHKLGSSSEARIISSDKVSDLALLKTEIKPEFVFPLSDKNPFELQEIIVAGFPFGDKISSSIKFTKGIVSSLAGVGNNFSQIQIDAAIQPGNSGGPIVDKKGNAVAVAVAKLDYKKIIENFGVIPENTNFGIKASTVRNFLEANDMILKDPTDEIELLTDLSQNIKKGTVSLSCWMTREQVQSLKSRKVFFTELDN